MESTCQKCGAAISPDAYFCPNCGAILREKPASTSLAAQIKVYAVSALLPPFGLVYVWKYLKQPDDASKRVGWIALVLTVLMPVLTVWLTIATINSFNQALDAAFNGSLQ